MRRCADHRRRRLPARCPRRQRRAGRPARRRRARARARALAANGTRARHYATDDKGQTTELNEQLAAEAVRRALADRGLPAAAVGMLATGTTAGTCSSPASRRWSTGGSAAARRSCCRRAACAPRRWRRCTPPWRRCAWASTAPRTSAPRSLLQRLRQAGHDPDEGRWFSNLATADNTGAASILVALQEARARFRPGDRVLLVVPESGRFTLAFAHLTCTGPGGQAGRRELAASPLGLPAPGDPPAGFIREFWDLAPIS